MKNLFISLLIILTGAQCANGAFPTSGASQASYCFKPPYTTQNVKPNINLIFDMSGSMQEPANIPSASCSGGSSVPAVSTCTDRSLTSESTERYIPETDYYGYFDSSKYYKYDSATANKYFIDNSSSCTSYTNRIGNSTGTGATACISGNLLNWILTTRIDAMRKIFTGGRRKSGSATGTTVVLENDGSKYTITDQGQHCVFTINSAPTGSSNTAYTTNRTIAISDQSSYTCSLGALSAAKTDVVVPLEDATGVIQGLYNTADLEVMVFGDTSARYKVGKLQTLDSYLDAVNNEAPDNSTPTGPAMTAAKDFWLQNTSAQALVKATVGATTTYLKDPYYDSDGGTTPTSLPVPCRRSFNLLISDGQWPDITVPSFAATMPSGVKSSDPLTDVNTMHTTDMRTALATGTLDKRTVTTYTVYAFGASGNDPGRNSMIAMAIFGGYEDKYGAHSATTTTTAVNGYPYPFTRIPYDSRSTRTHADTVPYALSFCNPAATWDQECAEWDKDRTGLPFNFFEGSDGAKLQQEITKAVNDMLHRASSGTAASMLGNSDSSGAVMLQALFFPEKQFRSSTKAQWLGELQAFWYYIDPKLSSANISLREDTVHDWKLSKTADRIARFVFKDPDTKVELYTDADGNGAADSTEYVEQNTDEIKALWRAGLTLWSRLPATDGRIVYTKDLNATPASNNLMDFSTVSANLALIKPYLDVANVDADATNVIKYTLGKDPTNNDLTSGEQDASLVGYRSRTVKTFLADGTTQETHVWKLGDIVNSTPKMISPNSLNTYNNPPPGGYNDLSYDRFVSTLSYRNRGVAFVGANDGMLHAFKMGKNIPGRSGFVAEIADSTDLNGNTPVDPTNLGRELWAYMPTNCLPYLKHRGNPSYNHMYFVDSTPTIVDASINAVTGTCSNDSLKGCSTDANCGGSATCTTVTPSCSSSISGCPKVDTSWRTVLVGSMGLGGATRKGPAKTSGIAITVVGASTKTFTRAGGSFVSDGWVTGMSFTSAGFSNPGNNGTFIISAVSTTVITCSTATTLVNGTGLAANATLTEVVTAPNAVQTPILYPTDKTKGFGYSSYFALDVTDSSAPKLLWEFSDPRLGYSTVGPAIVRIKNSSAETVGSQKNGKFYVVLASGPTGPVDTGLLQMKGYSDKPLAIFVLDLRTGNAVQTFSSDATALITGVNHTVVSTMPDLAFGGTFSNSSIDTDKWDSARSGFYSDDAIYLGYVRKDTTAASASVNHWSKGGVLRILTGDDPNPANWAVSTVIDGIGPVTSAVAKLQDPANKKLWLYFGTGRYFYKNGSTIDEDFTGQQEAIYGVQDLCYSVDNTDAHVNDLDPTCTTSVLTSQIQDQTTTIAATLDTDKKGWQINLAQAGTDFKAQRIYTNPTTTVKGVIFFTAFKPSSAVCSYGGSTSLWAVTYDTGGSLVGRNVQGQALLQLATGELKQIDLNTFTSRETGGFTGPPSRDETQITSNANHFPSKKILHIQER